ncbi:hypothetical protein Lser_V15G33953 [Lactuca serriola]
MIIFSVSESQFNQVLNIELDQIIEACKFLDEKWNPKFLVTIAQKNHHSKFFQQGSQDNVQPGTVIDNKVCHPRNNDFYMCAKDVRERELAKAFINKESVTVKLQRDDLHGL